MNKEPNFYDSIVGEKLSAITFVMDYWRLQFDGPTINALTRVQVSANGNVLRGGDDQFRNLERNPNGLNREGFPSGSNFDSYCLLDEEASGHGEILVGRSA
jgi:hypothetical protein